MMVEETVISGKKSYAKQKIFALLIGLIWLVIDQFTKQWALNAAHGLYPQLIKEVTSFFNLVLVWNRGVSFGIFSDHPEYIPYVLTGLTGIITLVLFVWLFRTPRIVAIYGLGLVISGAIGNIIDRVRFGAVVDFLDFYVGDYHWPAFNVADSVIFIGVALLLVDTILEGRENANEEPDAEDRNA